MLFVFRWNTEVGVTTDSINTSPERNLNTGQGNVPTIRNYYVCEQALF